MSRIAGYLSRNNPAARPTVARMLRFMAPSGAPAPQRIDDALGAFGWTGARDGGVAREGPLVLCLDGVIFNAGEFAELGADDATRLVRLVARRGLKEALAAVNGDFAVAVADLAGGTLQFARDRAGMKPLYYAVTGDGLAFASRCGALLGVDGVSAEPNHRFTAVFAGSHYRSIDNVPEESPFRDIAQVPAATVVTLKPGQPAQSERYWTLCRTDLSAHDPADLAARYRALLLDAVGVRVARAQRPAFTLSGGLDSSSVLSCAVEALGARQEAFSTVYSDATYDESEDIKTILDAKVATWHPVRVDDPPVLPSVEKMVRVNDEPVATATWLSHYYLAQEVASSGFGTLFGGMGGDELNAGEFEYFICHFADLKADGDPTLPHEIEGWRRHHDHPIYRKGPAEAAEQMALLTDPRKRGHVRVNEARLRRYFTAVNKDWYDLDRFVHVMDHPFDSWLLNRTYQDIFRETAPCCLRAEDRHTTAVQLQRFDPFYDYRLMEFMFSVPGSQKIRDGITKRLLRDAMAGILPDETRLRIKKTGWNAPAHRWFQGGRNLDDLRDLVGSRAFRERGLYNVAEVARLIDEHVDIVNTGRAAENHMMFLWQLVNVDTWLREIPEMAGRAKAPE